MAKQTSSPATHELLYHGTTGDRTPLIMDDAVLPMRRLDTGFTGVWMTALLDKSMQHARERGIERGGLLPVVFEFEFPLDWIRTHDDRAAVDAMGYDHNVHCFGIPLPSEFLRRCIVVEQVPAPTTTQ